MAKKKTGRAAPSPAKTAAATRKRNIKPSRSAPSPAPAIVVDARSKKELGVIRDKIDAIDKKLVGLLNDRAELVVRVGKLKRRAGLPIYTPHREVEVIDRAIRYSTGPLPERTLEGVYRELMSGSFALQQPLRIGYLGPPGSYSHAAAVKHFGNSVDFEDLREIAGVFTEVQRGHVNYGLVPIENSTGGGIVETLDAFRDAKSQITVCAEVQINVHHALLANCAPKAVRRIHSKPEVFSQCRVWLATQYPHAELIPAPSSSKAAQTAAEEFKTALSIGAEPGTAAIGSELSGQIYGLNVLFHKIEDNPSNITRFFVIGRQNVERTGDDKTSVMFNTANKPGALVSVLHAFEASGINLTHIDKRPSGRSNWSYTFFVDAQGHKDDAPMVAALKEAQTHCQHLSVLGSYPRSKRIL